MSARRTGTRPDWERPKRVLTQSGRSLQQLMLYILYTSTTNEVIIHMAYYI